MDYATLKRIFREHEKDNPKEHLTAQIRLSNRGPIQYTARSRTYLVSSESPVFMPSGRKELHGACMDGTCCDERLDDLICEETPGAPAHVEDCAIVGFLMLSAGDNGVVVGHHFFTSFLEAMESVLRGVAEKAGESAAELVQRYHAGKPLYKKGVYECGEESAQVIADNHTWTWQIHEFVMSKPQEYQELFA